MSAALACPHGMPSPAACVDCMDAGPVAPPARWVKVGTPFRAGFPGDCASCPRLIGVGQPVQRWDLGDQRTAYTHASCGAPS